MVERMKSMENKKVLVQTSLFPKQSKLDPKNRLNDLDGKEWIKFLKSWYVFDALKSDLDEERRITKDTKDHPATFSPTMVSEFIRFFTKKGMNVLDPFVGIGSTLVACDRTNRVGYGVELNSKFGNIAKKRVSNKQTVIAGDSTKLLDLGLPKMDFCITSPPYWSMLHKIDVNQKIRIKNGLSTKYSNKKEDLGNITDYEEFMEDLLNVFKQVHELLKPGKYMVIFVQNVVDRSVMIPFAWISQFGYRRHSY